MQSKNLRGVVCAGVLALTSLAVLAPSGASAHSVQRLPFRGPHRITIHVQPNHEPSLIVEGPILPGKRHFHREICREFSLYRLSGMA